MDFGVINMYDFGQFFSQQNLPLPFLFVLSNLTKTHTCGFLSSNMNCFRFILKASFCCSKKTRHTHF